jgi:uncharacterized membrane protein YgcG
MLSVRRKALLSFLSLIILAAFICAIPAAVLPVNGQVLSNDWRNDIEEYLLEVDKNTTAEIVIYIIDSLYGHGIMKDGTELNDIVQLGVYIFNELPLDTPSGSVTGIGKKRKDNGVLLLIAMEERKWRIEVGYGLEGYITDIESKHIAEEYLVPKFQEGLYGEGLSSTVEALAQEIPNVDQSEQMPTRGRYIYGIAGLPADDGIPWDVIVLIVIFVMIVLIPYARRFSGGRIGSGSGSRGGGGGSGRGGGGGGGSGGGGSSGGW